ncbi:hypothetical protein Solca_1693 [Solitalea canadensis DSM 3403]|uniref:Uncharacterized protein n=1 Tax=Solitalea canadensis (strain ATCC 29591 / DSM 3403 / JCM 21819 / LMG 8368 / NBRC 15130 / NCIMB 12057 / USAM 9D) TaxID=929556 RepID=H8KQM1_SOLCM|nr:hypothetical protein Solca_1693 [Solitalea canadensis DSM 3403]
MFLFYDSKKTMACDNPMSVGIDSKIFCWVCHFVFDFAGVFQLVINLTKKWVGQAAKLC